MAIYWRTAAQITCDNQLKRATDAYTAQDFLTAHLVTVLNRARKKPMTQITYVSNASEKQNTIRVVSLCLGLIGVAHTSASWMAPDFTSRHLRKISFDRSSLTQSRDLMVFCMLAKVPLTYLLVSC